MNVQTHWEKIYAEKAPDAVGWYRPHLETSLELIERASSTLAVANLRSSHLGAKSGATLHLVAVVCGVCSLIFPE
jgi:hypothetical protein